MTYEQLNQLHVDTGRTFFKDKNENVCDRCVQKDVDGNYIYGVDKMLEKNPLIDLTGFTKVNYNDITFPEI